MRESFAYIKERMTSTVKAGIVLGVAVVLLTATTLFAAPPGSQYNPADTLNPSCAPGSTNCSVNISSSSTITIGDDVVSGTADRVLFLDSSGNLDDSPDFTWRDSTKVFRVGDVSGTTNGTLLDLNDSAETFSVQASPNSGYTESIQISDDLLGLGLEGAGLVHTDTGSGDRAFISAADNTAIGGEDTTLLLGYMDSTVTDSAVGTLAQDEISLALTSSTGDSVSNSLYALPTEVGLLYNNTTDSVTNRVQLTEVSSSISFNDGDSSAVSLGGDGVSIDIDSTGNPMFQVRDGSNNNLIEADIDDFYVIIGDASDAANGTDLTVTDSTESITATTDNGFVVQNSAGTSSWVFADPSDQRVRIGDINATGNGIVLDLNDSANTFNISGRPVSGFNTEIEFGGASFFGGLGDGINIGSTKISTSEIMGLAIGDATGIGRTDLFTGIGYNNAAQTEVARGIFEPDDVQLQLKTVSGGDSGADTIDNKLEIEDNLIKISYANDTQSYAHDITIDDTAFEISFDNGTVNRGIRLNSSGISFVHGTGTYLFPTTDGQANQIMRTDGSGTLEWIDLYAGDTTNYHLARELDMNYKEDDFEVQSISEWDDPSYGGSHGLIYVAEHDYLFSAVRSSVQPEFTRFNDPDDLSDYTHVDTTGLGSYGYSDQIVYSPTKDKLYMVLNDFTYTQQNMRVIEIDPVTLAYTLVIDTDLGSGNRAGAGLLTELDGYLYVVEGYYTSIINKYDLSDYSLDDTLTIADADNAVHSLETDGTNLYFATTWNSTTQTVGVIDPSTMTLTDSQTYNFGTAVEASSGVTDDIVVWGDWLFMPLEGYTAAENKVVQINKNDLTDITYLDFGMTGTRGWYSIISDGEYIWFGGVDDKFGRFDPHTYTGELFDVSVLPGSNVNEIAVDGSRIFITGYDDPYPAGDAGDSYIARYSILPGNVETFTLDADGDQMFSIDKTNSRVGINVPAPTYSLDVDYDGSGVVSRFTSTDGNCTIDPSVVGGISCSSDESLKKDIEPIDESQLDKLNQVSPVEYHWKNDADEEQKTIGFIAQDVQEILPELVSLDPTTQKLTMSYAGLAVPLVGSVRELGLRLTALEALHDLNINGNTNKVTKLFSDFLLTTQRIVINGLAEIKQATIDRLFAKRVETEMFCIDDMCITKDEFKAILDANDLTEKAQDIFNGIEKEELEEILEESDDEVADDKEKVEENDDLESEEEDDASEETKEDDNSAGSGSNNETNEQIEETTETQEENTEETAEEGGESSDSDTEETVEDNQETENTEETTEIEPEATEEETVENTEELTEESSEEEVEETVENNENTEETTETESETEPEPEENSEPEPETEPEV